MADTIRTVPALLTMFATGGAPYNITPQKARDMIISLVRVTPSRKVANYVLVLADEGMAIEMNMAGANTVTIPPGIFPIGAVIEITQYGAGQTTLTPGAGVTIRTSSSLTTRAQYSVVSIRQSTADEWIAAGDLT